MIINFFKNGCVLKGVEVISFLMGIYWLYYIDVTSTIWIGIIIIISMVNIVLFFLHPKHINLFYSYYCFRYRREHSPRKAIFALRSFIPFAIGILIMFYLTSPSDTDLGDIHMIEAFYILSFIIYQLSFLRGGEIFIKCVEEIGSRKPV